MRRLYVCSSCKINMICVEILIAGMFRVQIIYNGSKEGTRQYVHTWIQQIHRNLAFSSTYELFQMVQNPKIKIPQILATSGRNQVHSVSTLQVFVSRKEDCRILCLLLGRIIYATNATNKLLFPRIQQTNADLCVVNVTRLYQTHNSIAKKSLRGFLYYYIDIATEYRRNERMYCFGKQKYVS